MRLRRCADREDGRIFTIVASEAQGRSEGCKECAVSGWALNGSIVVECDRD
ncbi:hypothetical protein HBI56_031520 [Parastagonospora nodorum]|uniref:Uncharacterized protein n=1 Tax=Phaeosphaeria nodorum (strain SN15 / ATCC MYA-4574 / FGSC 10173) TaxID=321614 RepID=A0A7U2HYH9_PHANO|nr:hypothetical protein HBH56_019200 [Parastagonospora nodorum]QRC95323.1 hypothetical protein JI435_030250 [Parastagonospora nodorum SN15]KAH3936801.1 hypothetical protein HBH54_015290 [Parastagonospora nodorum]KAH3953756.1 hypothetical protein HBH53_027440 [Parastagonospora nodorum]KAH3962571.1 hypothetical protein HBH51_174360 [Parastagonospora nodorum]